MVSALTESQWQQQVIELARVYGWWVYHTLNSKGSEPGFPDLTLIRAPELIFAELKTDKGRLTAPQECCLGDLAACGVETFIWRPADFEAVKSRLATPQPSLSGRA